jgi:Thymidylate synthase
MPEFMLRDNAESYKSLLRHVLSTGIEVSPRGQDTLEIEDMTLSLQSTSDVLAVGCGRGLNTRLAAYESLALIAGVSLPVKAVAVAPNLAQFINMETGDFDGAYGPRLRDQIPWIIDKLDRDKDTRQAVATIYRPTDLTAHSRDVPCTVYVRFAIRDGRLKMKTHMRSQDAWWGWPYDIVQFTQLGWTIANILGMPLGKYVHHVDSLHVYRRNLPDIQDFLTYWMEPAIRPTLTGLAVKEGGAWENAQERAHALLTINQDHPKDPTELWFADQKLWMF